MAKFTADSHWRDSARIPQFFMVDARAAFPFLLFLLDISFTTFLFAMFSLLFFSILEKFGFTVTVFFRWVKCFIAGPNKTSSPWWRD